MKTLLVCTLLSSLTMVMSCGSSQKVTNFWSNPEVGTTPAKSVFVVAITPDRGDRTTLETDLVNAATARGVQAIRSFDHFPTLMSKANAPTEEQLLGKIQELGCDAVFTLSLLDEKSEQRYVPGTTTYAGAYAPYPYYSHYGSVYGYYAHAYPVVTSPGYYTTDKTYFIEGNLYDVKTGKIRWSMQSTAYNPSSLTSFSKDYTKLLMEQLDKENKKPASQ